MTAPDIVAIVEGHGETEAVPVLVRRIAARCEPDFVPRITVNRHPATKLKQDGGLEKAVEYAARVVRHGGGVLILLDCDDGCPAQEGPALLGRARQARPDLAVSVVLAHREFECWFLAASDSLRGRRGLSQDLPLLPDPESVRAAKEWLGRHMEDGYGYSATTDQPALAAVFDLDQARRAGSFDKCYREVVDLLHRVQSSA